MVMSPMTVVWLVLTEVSEVLDVEEMDDGRTGRVWIELTEGRVA